MDDKLSTFSKKLPFQIKVASIIATDQVEILGTTFGSRDPSKRVEYDILSSVVHND